MMKGRDRNTVFVKVKKQSDTDLPVNGIRLLAVMQYNGQRVTTYLDCIRQRDYDPLHHYLYTTSLLKEVELIEIVDVTKI